MLPVLLAGLSLLAACGGGGGETSADRRTDQPTVTILGVVIGEQQDKLEAALAPFEAETGIDVVYEGTDAFATLLPVRVAANNAPDIAMFPQPGLLADFARSGDLIPLNQFIDRDVLTSAYSQDWIDLGSVDGESYGIWYRASVKSLVWYSPPAFDAAGYDIPSSWDELIALSDRIVADGRVPWCLGMESGSSTGWVGTDWIEDIMLRTAGAETYDRWVVNELPFDSPEVKAAFEQFGNIALNPDYVVGGTVGAISIPFGDSPNGLFSEPPQCYLHRQANFIASFFPKDVVLGEDVAIFPLPPIDRANGLPVLVAGDAFAALNDTPETEALMNYLVTTQPHEIWAGLGGFISPYSQVSLDVYPNAIARQQAEILANAETVRFDGSDMMPGAVGTGSFWAGVTDYVGGTPLDIVLSNIQASWPQE
ncbi:ABC transporter substrate-binding protein [Synechococcus sp. PCC 7336]|uniref:ABC transporter substrate-binding protein n=1 Tax=Synechococcus sp. PCC 7336 TaxID=195250 RepID=UPI0003617BAE|nr:ABC transporter substrate-binding protein [Synechococcus sp. PCC 7336]